jgi:hypothetical protein
MMFWARVGTVVLQAALAAGFYHLFVRFSGMSEIVAAICAVVIFCGRVPK